MPHVFIMLSFAGVHLLTTSISRLFNHATYFLAGLPNSGIYQCQSVGVINTVFCIPLQPFQDP